MEIQYVYPFLKDNDIDNFIQCFSQIQKDIFLMHWFYHKRLRLEELLCLLENGEPAFKYDDNDEKRCITEQERIEAIAEVKEEIKSFKMEKSPLLLALIRSGARIVYKKEPLDKIFWGYNFCYKDEYENNINWEKTKGWLEAID